MLLDGGLGQLHQTPRLLPPALLLLGPFQEGLDLGQHLLRGLRAVVPRFGEELHAQVVEDQGQPGTKARGRWGSLNTVAIRLATVVSSAKGCTPVRIS